MDGISGILVSNYWDFYRPHQLNNHLKKSRFIAAFFIPATVFSHLTPQLPGDIIELLAATKSYMQSVQEIFQLPQFRHHKVAVVQRMVASERNLNDVLHRNLTEWWPALKREDCTLVIASLKDSKGLKTLYAGNLRQPKDGEDSERRLLVDKFIKVAVVDPKLVPDTVFYGKTGRGGGSRDYVTNNEAIHPAPAFALSPGINIQRLTWVRKNHHLFADAVRAHWDGRCAVHDHAMPGLLVASHILPWSTHHAQRTDSDNGILLSSPLDALFDAFLISFDDDGNLIAHPSLDERTRVAFGIQDGMCLRAGKMTKGMQKHLREHRVLFEKAYGKT